MRCLKDGIQKKSKFLGEGAFHKVVRCDRTFGQGTGQHVKQQAAGFTDGTGFDQLGFGVGGSSTGEAQIANFNG